MERLACRGIPSCSVVTAFDGVTFSDLVVNGLDLHPNERAHRLAVDAAAPCIVAAVRPPS